MYVSVLCMLCSSLVSTMIPFLLLLLLLCVCQDVNAFISAGADVVLTKPLSRADIQRVVEIVRAGRQLCNTTMWAAAAANA
jgi:hypothetical protein